jgi:molybdopterin synthase catalytic subunit
VARDFEQELSAAQLAAQSGIRELLARHEAKVVSRLVTTHRSGALTPDEAKVGIAIIAELRTLAGDMDRTIERGRQAGEELTGASNGRSQNRRR